MSVASWQGAPRARRVPIEHRFLGLDTRTFPIALVVLGVFLLFTVVVPRVDAAIPWDDPVAAGDELALADSVVMVPATGWEVVAGFRVEPGGQGPVGPATVTGAGVVVDVTPGPFAGTPAELLDQIEKVTSSTADATFRATGAPTSTTTTSGEVGVLQTYSSVRGDGVVAAFVIDGTGVQLTAYGPPAQLRAAATQVDDMIASIRSTGTEGES